MTRPPLEQDWETIGRYGPFCLTFTLDVTPQNLLERYGADPATAHPVAFAETGPVLDPRPDQCILATGTLGEWAFCFETLGVEGIMSATLAALSHGTQSVAVNNDANAMHYLTHWADGQPQEEFEPGAPSTLRAAGPHPFWDATERHRALHPDQRNVVAALRAAGDHIGGRLTVRTLTAPLLTTVLTVPRSRPPSPAAPLPLVHPPQSTSKLGRRLAALDPLDADPTPTTLHSRVDLSGPGLPRTDREGS
ncbi:DUF6461 domain-containing protein [Frankia sp. AiPs1]|uniref:DUF6461 domain-containing protein n=1 Tax=Frankia sp. AiPs1 TaxID=573493 RepID=UPI002044B057|nr:DUF6461 domain-containing protein [Frankia sp. AiPs1]MCM3920199.1 DUF6461 domain-containing protein [Frankia sp. AiPs1]